MPNSKMFRPVQVGKKKRYTYARSQEVGKKVKQDFDLLEAYDMTLEATITKLMWLMAQPSNSYEEIKNRFYTMINHDILFAGFREEK